ncbi:MAG: zinc-binding dehydrogenase [Acidobacteria bacterium]|nr:zinc-binding dehydrogenase [Acidobacteriota bacterium]
MRSIQMVAPRTLEEREMPQAPDPGPGEVTVRIHAVGICGSDMHWYLEGGIGHFKAAYPQVLGHEPAGEVVAVGRGVTRVKPGDRVVVEPSITCGHCEFCIEGRHNNCIQSQFLGSPQMPGLFREYATVPQYNVDPIPASFSYSKATVTEPLAVIVHVLQLVEMRLGDSVAIMGGGSIGMLCAAVAKLRGASTVFVVDKVPHRLELARAMGADIGIHSPTENVREKILDHTRGRGVDVVFDAAAAVETINNGLAVARMGGQFTLIGIPSEHDLQIDLHTAMNKEIRIQTIRRSNHNCHAAMDLLESGRISDALVTHRLPLEATPRAFELLAHYEDGVGKVVIEF